LKVFILLMALLFLIASPVMSAECVEMGETQIVMDGGVLPAADAESVISIPALETQVSTLATQHNTTSLPMVLQTEWAALDAYDKQMYRTAISIAGRRG
jgi:hypothetical protein